MFMSINIDTAAEHIKNIVDCIRCAICDKTSGSRYRYLCGHTSCEECVAVAVDCSICLTPQADQKPVEDEPFTKRAANAVHLLNFFQNEFNIDVYKRLRLSEQLKIEKELFPECIQAPVKYFNKRKSLRTSTNNKENRLSQLPGEEISYLDKMDRSNENVQKWLNKHVRKPFADLNPNDQSLRRSSSLLNKQHIVDAENVSVQRSRKRPHIELACSVVRNQTLIDTHLTPVKNIKSHKKSKVATPIIADTLKLTEKHIEKDNNAESGILMDDKDKAESGVVMDEEAVIVLDDSESIKVDKDFNAWLAVQEAEKKIQKGSGSIISSKLSGKSDVNIKATEANNSTIKVPFYKKSLLSKSCIFCNGIYKDDYETNSTEQAKDVSITIENSSFIAMIKVTNVQNNNKVIRKESAEVQTEIIEPFGMRKDACIKENFHEKRFVKENSPLACYSQSQNLFKNDAKIVEAVNNDGNYKTVNKAQNVIIAESDSDEDIGASLSLEVTADVHQSCKEDDYGVLADVDNLMEHSKRPRRAARGFTPTSTDSSDKENFNPNRHRRTTNTKKKPVKK